MGNRLNKVIYLKGKLKLETPILIGNGLNNITDNDVLKDRNGNVFIPGTTWAGAIRDYLNKGFKNTEIQNAIEILFGGSNEDCNQSLIYFYDSTVENPGTVTIRDGIALEDFIKTTKKSAKYDYEILEVDNIFEFKASLVLRDKYKDKIPTFENLFKLIIKELENGNIFVGAKKNRGLGKVKLEESQVLYFHMDEKDILQDYLDFYWAESFNKRDGLPYKLGQEFLKSENPLIYKSDLFKITVPLKVRDTLFIRNYLLTNSDVDAEQINFKGKAIIPGTTLSGAFRNRIFTLIYDLVKEEKTAKEIVNNLFGTNEGEGRASRIIFTEIRDKKVKSKFSTIRRTKIDRFTGGACDRGLFDSRVAVGGTFDLCIILKNPKEYEIALILITLYDLMSGLLAIGGETSIGRGLLVNDENFQINKQAIEIDGMPLDEDTEEFYLEFLKEELMN